MGIPVSIDLNLQENYWSIAANSISMYDENNIYREVRGCVRAKLLKISKNKNPMSNIFGLSIFFVEEPPLYLLQGGRKLALIIYTYIYIPIYKHSRLRERQTASNIERR